MNNNTVVTVDKAYKNMNITLGINICAKHTKYIYLNDGTEFI